MARPTRLTRQQQPIIRDLIAKHDPLIRQAFLEVVSNAHAALDFAELVRLVEIGDWNRIEQLMRLNQALMFPLEDAVRAVIVAGGASVTLPKGIAGSFSFNGRHPRAEQIIAEAGARLVTEIGSPGVEPIRAIILQGQQERAGTAKTARRLAGVVNPRTGVREGGILGLDGPRAHRFQQVSQGMSTPEGVQDLVIKGRDGKLRLRYTTNAETRNRILAAYKKGEAVPAADRARVEKQFANKLLKERGEMIAQHETYTAQAQGRREAYTQLFESGKVESIDKKWNHQRSKNPRHDHAALDGTVVGFNEAYEMGDGTMMQYPHDPAGGITHSANCGCSVIYIPQYRRPT